MPAPGVGGAVTEGGAVHCGDCSLQGVAGGGGGGLFPLGGLPWPRAGGAILAAPRGALVPQGAAGGAGCGAGNRRAVTKAN